MIRSFLVDADDSVSLRQEKPMIQKRQSKFPGIIEKNESWNLG